MEEKKPKRSKGRWDRSDDFRVRLSEEEYEVYSGLFSGSDGLLGVEECNFEPQTGKFYDANPGGLQEYLTRDLYQRAVKRPPPDDPFLLEDQRLKRICELHPELTVNYCLANQTQALVEPLFLVRDQLAQMVRPPARPTSRREIPPTDQTLRYTLSRVGFSGDQQFALLNLHQDYPHTEGMMYEAFILLELRNHQWHPVASRMCRMS